MTKSVTPEYAARRGSAPVCCEGRAIMSLDSMPPYVYCTGCGKPIPCPRCGRPTGGDCYPECGDAA